MTNKTSLTRPKPSVWQITISHEPENRLDFDVLNDIRLYLDTIEAEWRSKGEAPGAVVFSSSNPKFFSNGFVIANLRRPGFSEQVAYPTFQRVMEFPLVTVAAINGHAFAGGMLLAMSCDYRVMTDGKGWMSMNENLIGLPLPSNVCRLLFARCHPNVMRDICLGKRWTSQEALPAGLIDDIRPYGQPVVDRAVEIAEAEGYRSAKGSLGLIKNGLWHHVEDSLLARRMTFGPDMEEEKFNVRLVKEKAAL